MGILNILVSIFFCLGAVDFLFGNRMGLGDSFKEGLSSISELLLLMTGFMVLAPWIGAKLVLCVGPFFQHVGCDPSLIAGMFISCDSGAAVLADAMALSHDAALFNGIIVGAFMGITFIFTIPFVLSHSSGKQQELAVKGLLIGIIPLPVGCFITGYLAGIPLGVIMSNIWPVALFSICLLFVFLFLKSRIVPVFQNVSYLVRGISIIGFCLEMLDEFAGLKILPGLTPFDEIFPVITEIGVFLAGILPFIALAEKVLQKPLATVARVLGINSDSVTAMVLSMVNPIPVFLDFEKLDLKGSLFVTAFLTPSCFAIGDYLAFTMQYAPSAAIPLMVGKILTGCIAIILAIICAPILLPCVQDA